MGIEYEAKINNKTGIELFSIIHNEICDNSNYSIIDFDSSGFVEIKDNQIVVAVNQFVSQNDDLRNGHIWLEVTKDKIYVLFMLMINKTFEDSFLITLQDALSKKGLEAHFEQL